MEHLRARGVLMRDLREKYKLGPIANASTTELVAEKSRLPDVRAVISVRPATSSSNGAEELFTEFRLLTTLQHPFILHAAGLFLIEAEDSTQLIGLATEGIYPRETLHSAMPTAGFAPDAAVDLMREALQPVMYLHEQHIMHLGISTYAF